MTDFLIRHLNHDFAFRVGGNVVTVEEKQHGSLAYKEIVRNKHIGMLQEAHVL